MTGNRCDRGPHRQAVERVEDAQDPRGPLMSPRPLTHGRDEPLERCVFLGCLAPLRNGQHPDRFSACTVTLNRKCVRTHVILLHPLHQVPPWFARRDRDSFAGYEPTQHMLTILEYEE